MNEPWNELRLTYCYATLVLALWKRPFPFTLLPISDGIAYKLKLFVCYQEEIFWKHTWPNENLFPWRLIHNGRFRSYPAEAYHFWHEHGWIVGEILRLELGMTFAEIVIACEEYLLEHLEFGMLLSLNEEYLDWCQIKLLDYGLAIPVVTFATPTWSLSPQ